MDKKLKYSWNLSYHLPEDKSWTLSSYKDIMMDIDTVEKTFAINENFPEQIIKYCMLFFMRKTITPMWEDVQNREGGCFSFKVSHKYVSTVWKELVYLVCGNTLTKNSKHMEYVNGITVSPKKNFCILKIWMRGCTLQDTDIIVDVCNLLKTGCMFRKHAPEY